MRVVFKFILFAILFNLAAFCIASTSWFPNTLYGNAMGDLELTDTASLVGPEDVFMQLLVNNIDNNPISLFGVPLLDFGILMGVFVGASVLTAIVAKGGGPVIIGMGVISVLFYTMYANSKNFFDNIISNFPAQVSYIAIMIGFCLLFMFIILIADFSSGQKSTS